MKLLSKKVLFVGLLSALLMSTMTGCGDASGSDSSSKEANSKQSQSEVEKESSSKAEKVEKDTDSDTSEETPKSEALDVELVDSGWSLSSNNDYIRYGVIVTNPDKNNTYKFYKILVTIYDKDGSVLSTEKQTMGVIAPEETQAFASSVNTKGEMPDKVEFIIEPGRITKPSDHIASSEFEISGTKDRVERRGKVSFTGMIKNNSGFDCKSAGLTILLRKDGKIVYGRTTYVDDINSGKEMAFDVSEYSVPEYDSYEIYAHDWM